MDSEVKDSSEEQEKSPAESSDMLRESKIRGRAMFRSLPPNELGKLVKRLKPIEVEKGEVLFKEGDQGDKVYIVVTGELEVIREIGTPDEHLVTVSQSGNFIGDMSLFVSNGIRSATVRGRKKSALVEMSIKDFEELLESSPIMGLKVMRELGERLKENNDLLQEKNHELAVAYDELKDAQAELVEKEKMEHELSLAHNIQMSILPEHILQPEGVDIGAQTRAARAVGGDFYDVIDLGDGKVGVAIGDVTDKGVAAALFMAQVCTLLRLEAQRHKRPENVLKEIHNSLYEMNDAGLYVTTIYGVYDSKKNKFTYARAGHEVPLLFDKQGKITELPYAQGMPLCLLPEPVIDVQSIAVPPGSTLFMYTDGGTDAMSEDEQFFGLDNLEKMVEDNLDGSAQDLVDHVLEGLVSFQGDKQFDDATLVAIKTL